MAVHALLITCEIYSFPRVLSASHYHATWSQVLYQKDKLHFSDPGNFNQVCYFAVILTH
jgi:hypothetical protein